MGAHGRMVGSWGLAGALAAILAAGCSSAGPAGPTTYPVRGKVVYPGGQPWTGGRVTFRSVRDPSIVAAGDIQADGDFTLTTHYTAAGQAYTKPGAVAGEHTVTVEPPGAPVKRGESKTPPIALPRKYQIEERENSLTLETPKPARR